MESTIVYAFASDKLSHIEKGYREQRWAVRPHRNDSALSTKALSMPVGSFGILYCADDLTEDYFLTVPFRVTENPGSFRNDVPVWPEFQHEFGIRPLGSPDRRIWKSEIPRFLRRSVHDAYWNRVLRVAAGMAFVPSEIEQTDWNEIVAYLSDELPRG